MVKVFAAATAILGAASSASALKPLAEASEVVTVVPRTMEAAKSLASLDESQFDFWQEVMGPNIPADLRVTAKQKEMLVNLYGSENVKTKIADVRALVETSKQKKSKGGFKYKPNEYHDSYHVIEEVLEFVSALEENYSELVSVEQYGESYEGRPLLVACVSTDGCKGEKPAFWISGGIHAREWISHSTVLYIFENLILEHLSGADDLLEKMDFYIAPHTNPDGYAHTDSERMWRKSRKPNDGSRCVGTDLNRNYAYEWGGVGASTNPCSDTYRGASPADNVEVSTLSEAIWARKNINVFFDVHSYGNYFLSPWGYTSELPKDYADHQGASKAGFEALKAVNGTSYTYGPSGETLYPTSGSAPDGFYCQAPKGTAKYSYTAELPGYIYGFLLPESYIVPVGKETHEGFKAFARYALENPTCA